MMTIGAAFGVPLRMHMAFPVLMAAAAMLGQARALLMLLAALTLHEAAHAAAARAVGHRFDAIELMPFGGVARMDTAPQLRPNQEAAIALAGPFASLSVAVLLAALRPAGQFAADFWRANLLLAATNLVPALPLDGGRALRAALSGRLGRARATRLFARVGTCIGAAVAAVGVWAASRGVVNPMLFLTGAYLIYAAQKEKESLAAACFTALHRRADRLRGEGALPVRWVAVARDTPPAGLVARLSAGSYSVFMMVDDDLKRLETIDEGEALRRALQKRMGE